MALSRDMRMARHRLVMSGLGAAAALALWALGKSWGRPIVPPMLFLASFTFVTSYAVVALALAGPLAVARALRGALVLAVPVTLLACLAGLRQTTATDFLDDPVMLSVISVLVLVATPFLQVWLCEPAQWRSYAALFDAAWSVVVRYFVACGFVAVFWVLVFLSDALLELVDIHLLDRVLRFNPVRFGLSGAMLGLGLAVVYEMRQTVSPFLFLRLLRLLVPPVLLVLVVFAAALPLRGISELFGEFSSAATLMGSVIAAITLVSAALDRDDAHAVSTPGIRAATRALAMLLPFLAGLAVWAVVLRVQQYGWTPDRLLAATSAAFLLAYGAAYAVAALRGGGWPARVRGVNVVMAMAVVVAAALWLTPLFNVYRISANNQVARLMDGRSGMDDLPFWALQHKWGRAGHSALAEIQSAEGPWDSAALNARIAAVREAPDPFRFEKAVRQGRVPGDARALADILEVRPAGSALGVEVLETARHHHLQKWLDGCRRPLPDGRPGCVFLSGAFSPAASAAGQGMMLYLDSRNQTRINHVQYDGDGEFQVREVVDPVTATWPVLAPEAVAQVLDGTFDIRPPGGNALYLGDAVLVPVF